MRRVLVDYAAAKSAHKRGDDAVRIARDGDLGAAAATKSDELLALDDALRRLATLDGRQARVVDCRFFAGMRVEETASALEISPATVKRDWVAARAWLNAELGT